MPANDQTPKGHATSPHSKQPQAYDNPARARSKTTRPSASATGLESLVAKYGITTQEMPMDAQEVALRLGVSPQQVYKIAHTIGGYYRIGRRVKFNRQKFEDWLSRRTMDGKG